MTIIPAIDMMGGACVRLRQGAYEDKTVYDADPVAVAASLVADGAQRIHLVDLDAARGDGDNRSAVAAIRREVPVILELGGGIRTREAVDAVLSLGVDYAIVGTVLAREQERVAEWAGEMGDRMIASIDARDGLVRVHGWQESTGIPAVELARYAGAIGLAAVEYTNIAKDGTLEGPDIAGTLAVAEATTIPVILSGGVSRTGDAVAVKREGRGLIAGVIVGRALYEGRFNLAAAIAEVGVGG